MACPAVSTGRAFLSQTIYHLDCQAQTLGSFGFQSLAQPGSLAGSLLLALLTLFIAIFGFRLLFGGGVGSSDIASSVLKIGIVLTLALNWPAFRVLAYDTVLYGPAEIADAIIPDDQFEASAGFVERLQSIDTGILSLTTYGTGRRTGSLENAQDETETFSAIASGDNDGFATARTTYLWSTIASLAVLRVMTGLLLALAPVFAAFLFFDAVRGFFAGWLRGLVLCGLGSVGLTVLQSVQLAVLTPWLNSALSQRALGYATPSAPTELMALCLAFAAASFALLYLLTKVAFQNDWGALVRIEGAGRDVGRSHLAPVVHASVPPAAAVTSSSRAYAISEGVTNIMRREGGSAAAPASRDAANASAPSHSAGLAGSGSSVRFRRGASRSSVAQRRRDRM